MSTTHDSEIRKQSESAYRQWAVLWREHAVKNRLIADRLWGGFKPIDEMNNTGVGKTCLLVANGYSLEAEIETIKKYGDNVDIVACDKTLVTLLAHGIKPKYCIVCDANVSYEKYLAPVADQLADTIMISNVCGNPLWAEAKWKDAYFFINMDILGSEKEFSAISGCENFIIAATNVSNAMLVLMTQCRNDAVQNVYGYDSYLLIGFDYCWSDKSYYAFDVEAGGKQNYMRHLYLPDAHGNSVYSSGNLLFSARWLNRYIKTYNIRAIQCSKNTIMAGSALGDLAKYMQYKYKPEDSQTVRNLITCRKEIITRIEAIDSALNQIYKDHNLSALKFG